MNIGLGVDVGGSKILACAIDADGDLLAEARVESPTTQAQLVDALEEAIVEVAGALDLEEGSPLAVGIGLPGLVDADGVLHETANMTRAEGLDVRPQLSPRLAKQIAKSGAITITVENDATCAAAGEWTFGAARSWRDVVVATLGTGIGGGVIIDGEIAHGALGFAGEIGHMVINPDGPLCGCGGNGCWEQYASGPGIARRAKETLADGRASRIVELAGGALEDVRSEHVFLAAQEDDPKALSVIDDFSSYLAIGLNNLAEILDPGCIILGGGLCEQGAMFLDATREHFERFRRGRGERRVKVELATLGERAGAIGAASIALGLIR